MGAVKKKGLGRPAIARLRIAFQGGMVLVSLWIGYRFYLFHRWAVGDSPVMAPRPPGVEGFLPISALLGLKRWLLTGAWDEVHPAGLAIFLTILAMALLLRKGFCGWLCPVGGVSRAVEALGRRLKLGWNPPRWLDYPLLSLKYLLLSFFLYVILYRMDLGQVEAFLHSPYNMAVDARMLHFFIHPSTTTVVTLSALVLLSLAVPNFWCRYLCPYGALLGLLALASPLAIGRRAERCIHCRRCSQACPTGIDVEARERIRTPECLGCLECLAVCPVDGCLETAAPRGRTLPWWLLPAGLLLLSLTGYLLARATGHWQTHVPLSLFRELYSRAPQLTHPSF